MNDAPASPAYGNCFLVGASPTGAWAGNANALASYSAAGWRFIAPVEGMQAWVKSLQVVARYRSGAWEIGAARAERLLIGGEQVVGTRAAAIADPAGGTTIDAESRSAVAAILVALRQHGLIAAV